MIRHKLIFIVAGITGILLLYYALITTERTYAIVAEVEPQKTAISFPKPVKIKSIHVKPGSRVEQGDPLLSVERPDLELDFKKLTNEMDQLELNIQLLEKSYAAGQKIASLKFEQKSAEINGRQEVLQLEFKSDSTFYQGLTRNPNSEESGRLTAYRIQMNQLNAEKELLNRTFLLQKMQLKEEFDLEKETLQLKKEQVQNELTALIEERKNLDQFASLTGTIGTVSVELMELVPPFETILSIYNENPNFIKAYMNEQVRIPVNVGDKVIVESINRTYSIEGEVIEVGSRIVSYPKQMNPADLTPLWGRELFVQIPTQNEFLNGEKVYVLINSN